MTGRDENVARMSEARCGIGGSKRKRAQAELEKQWLEDNREAIAHYNRRVAELGLLSDDAGLL
jgi:post-segregation antitoxin (ccd killing protein)